MIAKESLLEAYKTYDYLNADAAHPTVKIFVSYIKPSFLFKSEILTPIHLGRAVETANSKDGTVSETDLQWLHRNCIGDDDVEGSISALNRRIGFFTGTYWAWKNYERLGSPEYFGSFGYRKLLVPNCLSNLSDYDAILPALLPNRETIRQQLRHSHGDAVVDMLMDVVRNCFTEDERLGFEEYANRTDGYFHELYIFRKDLFFAFGEWMFSKLCFLLERYPSVVSMRPTGSFGPIGKIREHFVDFLGADVCEHCEHELRDKQCKREKRDLAFLLERLTGFYLYDKIVRAGLRYYEAEVVNYAQCIEANSPFRMAIIDKMRSQVRTINKI